MSGIAGTEPGVIAGRNEGSAMPTELSPKIQTWPIDESILQNDFKALMEEEDGIIQHPWVSLCSVCEKRPNNVSLRCSTRLYFAFLLEVEIADKHLLINQLLIQPSALHLSRMSVVQRNLVLCK